MWKGYGYREGDTFSGVTIGVSVRKEEVFKRKRD